MATAAILVIGNEILSGRTKDANIAFLGEKLADMGIPVRECRIIADIEEEIVSALNALRSKYSYVFTTGGIGPTHDDITADCVAMAFEKELIVDPHAKRLVEEACAKSGVPVNEARLRMARIPEGGRLIDNPVSGAPGFQIDNVFVMAGVPKIMQAMFAHVTERLEGGAPVLSITIASSLPEGTMAKDLGEIATNYPTLDIGSYPSFASTGYRVTLVIRGQDEEQLQLSAKEIEQMITKLGGTVLEA